MDAADQLVNEWDQCDDYQCDVMSKEIIANLIGYLNNCQDDDKSDERERFLQLLATSNGVMRLVDVLQVTQDIQILTNALTILRALTDDMKSGRNGSLNRARLLPVLMNMTLDDSTAPKECRYLIVDVLTQFFKNKVNSVAACQETNLVANLLQVLESTNGKGGRKFNQKRRKMVANALSVLSKLKEGRQLMDDGDVLRRLHGYVATLPDDKCLDAILNKIGLAILRCAALQNLPLSKSHSALTFPAFAVGADVSDVNHVNHLNDWVSDMSEDSDWEDAETSVPSVPSVPSVQRAKVTRKNDILTINRPRSLAQLQRYARFFNADDEDDADTDADADDAGWSHVQPQWHRQRIYEYFARRTRCIRPFRIMAYPDWINAQATGPNEKLYGKDRNVCRTKLLATLESAVVGDAGRRHDVVYDVEAEAELLLQKSGSDAEPLQMADVALTETPVSGRTLNFESRFESGNLRRVFQVGESEYDLILNSDVNSAGRQQWFYFRLSNIRSEVAYTFNIINMEKSKSLFNQGMQPVMFSVRRCLATGEAQWQRSGSNICYYRNNYRNYVSAKSYWTLSFDLTFSYDADVVYVAYHYPYTYSQMMTDIAMWRRQEDEQLRRRRFRTFALCKSPCGNVVPLLLIGRHGNLSRERCRLSFFSGRVHPVESNSSHVMRGLISAALADPSPQRQQQHLNVIIPFLNVDGVIHGCSRCELGNEDLNRRWLQPDALRHPSIYHAKGVLEYICGPLANRPVVMCDVHGHSRRFNVFFYGCCKRQSWALHDRSSSVDDHLISRGLVEQVAGVSQLVDVSQCSWQVEKERETTARIVAWRHLNIATSSTLECSLAGSDGPALNGLHFNTASYVEVGRALYASSGRMAHAELGAALPPSN